MSKLSNFKIGDPVRVTQNMHAAFDKVGVVVAHRRPSTWLVHDQPEVAVKFPKWDGTPLPTQERHLTLADPDVHTVLDQMDAESSAEPNRRAQVLRTAESLVNGQRADDYGPPAENFQRIGNLWAEILGVPVRPEQVALCMAQVKIARLITSPTHEDSWIDLAGYAALGGEIAANNQG